MDLSVVIPTHNQAPLLRISLGALLDQTLPADRYELIAVDDGSTDETPDVLAAAAPRVRSIALDANRGRSAARNRGIQAALAPVIVFVDSDIIVRRDFLAWHHRTHLSQGPQIVSRGPVVAIRTAAEAVTAQSPRIAPSPAYLDTANAAVARADLERAGLFDEDFPGYGWEDFELGLRLKRLGVRRVFCPQAVGFHVQPPQWDAVEELIRKEEARARSAAYFLRKRPALETRFLIQLTPIHSLAYWLLSVGGWLGPDRAAALAGRADRAGHPALAFANGRAGLNRHYLAALRRELRADAPALA